MWFNVWKLIKVIHCNRLEEKNPRRKITSVDTEKAFWQNPKTFIIKTLHELELSQPNKGHLWKTHSLHYTHWWKTESFHSKIRNKTRTNILSTGILHVLGRKSRQNIRQLKEIKGIQIEKKRKEAKVSLFAGLIFYIEDPKNPHTHMHKNSC